MMVVEARVEKESCAPEEVAPDGLETMREEAFAPALTSEVVATPYTVSPPPAAPVPTVVEAREMMPPLVFRSEEKTLLPENVLLSESSVVDAEDPVVTQTPPTAKQPAVMLKPPVP